jgi:hypothetical protein
MNSYAHNRFDVWQRLFGMYTNKKSEEIPLHDIRQMSIHFFLLFCKDNGSALSN